MRYETYDYIIRHDLLTPIFKKYGAPINITDRINEFCFIGGEHLVPVELEQDFIDLWINFDKQHRTNISISVQKIFLAKKINKEYSLKMLKNEKILRKEEKQDKKEKERIEEEII